LIPANKTLNVKKQQKKEMNKI